MRARKGTFIIAKFPPCGKQPGASPPSHPRPIFPQTSLFCLLVEAAPTVHSHIKILAVFFQCQTKKFSILISTFPFSTPDTSVCREIAEVALGGSLEQ